MKVATKIVTLAGTLIVLLTVVLALHVWWVQELARATQRLPQTIFRVGSSQLEIERGLHELIQFSRKAAIVPDWEEGIPAIRERVQAEMRTLATFELDPAEQNALIELQSQWQTYARLDPLTAQRLETDPDPAADRTETADREAALEEPAVAGEPAPVDLALLAAHLEQLGELRSRLREFQEATEFHVGARRREAARTVSLTKRIAWATVVGVLLLTLPLLWWTIRSIHRPLRRLTAGTRDVAEGRFALQLDTSSGDELAEVAASFNRMVGRLRELDELKRDFLSHVSHELNTPLVAMRETNELLLDGLAGPLTREQSRMLELNRDGAMRLSGMIGKILDLSRLEAGAMEYEFTTVDLNDLIRQVVEEFGAAAHDRDVTFDTRLAEPPVRATCDRDRMLQVLENLVSNALKFAPRSSVVRIEVERPDRGRGLAARLQRPGRRAVVTVSDRGPGVEESEREAIFERFHRSGSDSPPGFGLGLAISREIVEAHGGRIWVRDNPPGGSTFGVEVAAANEPVTAEVDPGTPRAAAGGAS